MSKFWFSILNPIVRFILRSPGHGIMSHNTVLLEFTGRKSGKVYVMPVSYNRIGAQVHCFTEKNNQWWRNLAGSDAVRLTLRGDAIVGKPTVATTATAETRAALRDLLIASPRDASHAGVGFDAEGLPIEDDITAASEKLVFISIELETPDPAKNGASTL